MPERVARKIQCKWFSCWYSLNWLWAPGSSGLGFSAPVTPVFVQFSNLLMMYNSSIIILINCLLALYGPETIERMRRTENRASANRKQCVSFRFSLSSSHGMILRCPQCHLRLLSYNRSNQQFERCVGEWSAELEQRVRIGERKRGGCRLPTCLNFLCCWIRRSRIEFAVWKSNSDAQTKLQDPWFVCRSKRCHLIKPEWIGFFVSQGCIVIALFHFFDTALKETKRERSFDIHLFLPYHRDVFSLALISDLPPIGPCLFVAIVQKNSVKGLRGSSTRLNTSWILLAGRG